jgi:hypothetical protein
MGVCFSGLAPDLHLKGVPVAGLELTRSGGSTHDQRSEDAREAGE